MKRLCLLLLLLTFSFGCAHGLTQSFPRGKSEDFAQVTVIRNNNFLGAVCNVIFTLDMATIAYIGVGEFIAFHLEPGKHRLGINGSTCGGHANWEQAYNFEPRKEYYFLIGPSTKVLGFDYEQITKEKATKWLETPEVKNLVEKLK